MAVADPSSRPTPAQPHWPLWLPVAGVGCGVSFGLLVLSVISGIANRSSSPGLTAAGTVLVDVSVVVACLLLAGLVTRPRPAQFGLSGAPLALAARVAAIGALAYFLFSVLYDAIVQPHNPQKVVQSLGADTSSLMLVIGALVVIVVAPVCEEIFFRGVLFTVLRQRVPFWPAALADGVLFGFVHGALVIVPVLAALGVMFCWVYERTGSIFPTIALHALNNTIAYGATTHNGWAPALAVGASMICACTVALARTPRVGQPA